MRRPDSIPVLILAALLITSCGRAQGIKVTADRDANPWTHLEVRNDPSNFQFAIVSDRTGGNRPGPFEDAIGKLNLLQPEFVMCIGDLIEGYTEDGEILDRMWSEFEGLVSGLEMPFFYVVGNHDITNETMIGEWNERFGRPYYHFVYHNVLFLCLDTEDPPRAAGADSLGEKQLRYFKKAIRKNRWVDWVLVFMHKPMWKRASSGNWAQMESLLEGHNFTVFAGHDHVYEKSVLRGKNYYVLATTGGSSTLSGIEDGRFDHIVWVTMTPEGPRVVNMMLDGLYDDDPRGPSP